MPVARDPRNLRCTRRLEAEAERRGWRLIAGVDEAGRGALLGPLFAAAVILDPAKPIHGVDDSKKLSARVRENLSLEIHEKAIAWRVVSVSAADVDRWNVYEASRRAMLDALKKLLPAPDFVLTDAMPLHRDGDFIIAHRAVVHGDARSVSIAAASILAKVERDRCLDELDRQFPQYHLTANKGYGTAGHLDALRRFGPCIEHRRTYQPVKDLLCPPLFAERSDGGSSDRSIRGKR